MIKQIKALAAAPTFADEEKTNQAQLLHAILMATLSMSLAIIVIRLARDPHYSSLPIAVISLIILLALVNLYLMRRGRVRLASLLFSSALWGLLVLAALLGGGVRSVSFSSLITVVFMVTLLLGRNSGMVFAGLSLLAGLMLTYREAQGLIFYALADSTPYNVWLSLGANVIIVAVLLDHVMNKFKRMLQRSRRQEQALARANRALALAHDELEQMVRERTAELEQANEDLETMLYAISHDLKEPLRAIHSFSHLVNLRYGSELDAKGQDFLQRIERAGLRLSDLFDGILSLSRAQRMDATRQQVAAATLVGQAMERLENRLQETGASVSIAADLPQLYVNTTWATEAIYNLVENALKYSGNGLPPQVTVDEYQSAHETGLIVKDRGPGVPPQETERIFQLFQRGAGRDVEGTGAGLAIVRQIAERHGGRAWVQPRAGGGSEFVVTFARENNAAHS